MGAGLPADMRRAQSGQVPCSDALARRDKVLDEVSAAILDDAQASARTAGCAAAFPSGPAPTKGWTLIIIIPKTEDTLVNYVI